MLHPFEKRCHITPLPLCNGQSSLQWSLSSVPKLAIVMRLDCNDSVSESKHFIPFPFGDSYRILKVIRASNECTE